MQDRLYTFGMTEDLFSQAHQVADFFGRAVSPKFELGAYEALWAKQGVWFKSIAKQFRARPSAIPSDFVSADEAEKYSMLALNAIRDAGIKHFGIRIHGAGDYPQHLRDAEHPVELLYFQGVWDLVNSPCVAVVGTRKPTEEGIRRTEKLVRALVDDGFTVVSGLARGIDTVAHKTAIGSGGFTIAVLGTPITKFYPPENRALQQRIADEHLIISQVPIVRYSQQHVGANRYFFPERNVTMSALTVATIIVEAGETSGALIQARHALKQGRKLFILESCFQNPSLSWPERIAGLGAIRVADYKEIRRHLASTNSRKTVES